MTALISSFRRGEDVLSLHSRFFEACSGREPGAETSANAASVQWRISSRQVCPKVPWTQVVYSGHSSEAGLEEAGSGVQRPRRTHVGCLMGWAREPVGVRSGSAHE